MRPTQSLVSLMNFGTPAFDSGDPPGPRLVNALATRLLSVIKGAMAVHSERLAALKSVGPEVDPADVGVDAEGAADMEERAKSTMPTTSAAVASTMAAATAITKPLLRRGGGP